MQAGSGASTAWKAIARVAIRRK